MTSTSPLRPEVLAGWVAFTEPFEGRIHWPYLDTHEPPIVTVGLGCALLSLASFLAQPWLTEAGSPAGEWDIRSAWSALEDMAPGRVASYYRYPGCLHLDDDAIDALALARLEGIAATLAAYWPAFPSFPAAAQQALCSLAYAVGDGDTGHGLTGPEWPHLQAAVARQDWQACAAEGVLRGNARRNDANVALFREAAT
jgi:hypothetical protein